MLTAAIAAQKISLERFAMIRPLRAVKQDDALLSTRRRLELARSAAIIVKVFVAVKSCIFYLLLHIGFSYPIGYPQA